MIAASLFASAYYERHLRSPPMSAREELALKEKHEAVGALLSASAARVLEAVEGAIGALDAYKAQQERVFPCDGIQRMRRSLEDAFREAMDAAQLRKGEAMRASEGARVARARAKAEAQKESQKAASEAKEAMRHKRRAECKKATAVKTLRGDGGIKVSRSASLSESFDDDDDDDDE